MVRKLRYLAHLEHVDARALLVAAADKLDNARAILEDYRELGEALWPRFNAPKGGTIWYFRACVGILQVRFPGQLTSELEETVGALECRVRLMPQSTLDAADAMGTRRKP
jgi:hypothetical protein